jgi:hypothetical protein
MKRLEKNKEPVEFLFSRTPTGDFRVAKKCAKSKKSTPISELKRV